LHREPTGQIAPQLHFIFDGSSNHAARAPDARHVGAGINKDAGGKNAPGARANATRPAIPKMCDGWYTSKETGEQVQQSMHRAATEEELLANQDLKGINEDGTIFKGIYAILREGGDNCKDDNGAALVKECSKARRLLAGCARGESCKKHERCCLQNCLRWRPDFANQKCKLEQVCNAAGCYFLMLPKCHPELNPIENYWSYTKRYCRQWCDYTVAGPSRVLPLAFLSAKMDWIRKAFERCDRYLDIYAMAKSAMPFGIREYMVKKYKSHRMVLTTIDALLDRTFDDLLALKVGSFE
jgi:hypothetical protein